MYPKPSALPSAHLLTVVATHPSRNGYSLHWLKDEQGFSPNQAEMAQLLHRSRSSNISARADWRHTLAKPPGWVEKTLLVRHQGELKAAIFLREKQIAGFNTGYLQGASTLGNTLILCDSGREIQYLTLASELLLERSDAFLLLLQQSSEEADELTFSPNLQQRTIPAVVHWQTPLKFSLDATIESFSHRTRRNIRASLRHVDASGWKFIPDVDIHQMKLAFRDLAGRCTHPFSIQEAEEKLAVVTSTEGCFAMGLTDADGRWLCCLIGRRTPQATEIFWQLNAAGCRTLSLCITMRALMMREEIRRHAPQILYIGGSCTLALPSESRHTLIARPGLRLRLVRALMRLRSSSGPVLRELL